ncbi:penicillin-binding protein [Streptococcus pyogenes]|uniref:penicillin-binding protein n=1 Tax=Streptococcus pyogenes TaxID=1314 RepID=UPI0010A1671F|nr:penicillin-binding protein [Streptococcus pyogenes]
MANPNGSVTIHAKIGTAETCIIDNSDQTLVTYNLNVVAYNTNNEDNIAVAVMYPHITNISAKM